jgi:hypothetical protein
MNQVNKILIAALALQVVLVVVTWNACQRKSDKVDPQPVLGFAAEDVTGLEVVAKANKPDQGPDKVELARKDGKWVVANAGDYPADEEKVTKVIEQLAELKIREPIARSKTNHEALKVGEFEYGRKLKVRTASEEKALIIGAGKGQSIHLRYADKDDVYQAAGMSAWSVHSKVRNYIDTKYLSLEKDKVNALTVTNPKGQLTFTRQGEEGWALAELPPDEELDQSQVTLLVNRMSNVNLSQPLGKEVKPEYGLAQGTRVVLVSSEEGETVTTSYTIGAMTGEEYYLKADDNEFVITVAKWATGEATEKVAADFVKKEPEAGASPAPAPGAMPPGAMPPGAMPPGMMPPGALPPGAKPVPPARP